MINEYDKLRLIDSSGNDNHLLIEVNWNLEDNETNRCKILRLTYPDGKHAYVKKEHLLSFLFAIGKPEEQRALIPTKITRVRWYETVVGVTAKKDIRKGEKIRFPIKLSLPKIEDEVIGELSKRYEVPKGEIKKKIITTAS